MSILDELAAHARERVEAARRLRPLEELRARCEAAGPAFGGAFAGVRMLRDFTMSDLIFRAPSLEAIGNNFSELLPIAVGIAFARSYEAAEADAISCLTEPKWFKGSDEIFAEVREAVDLPMLRKDFTVDEYQLFEARLLGASCVLLICALLDTATIERYLRICDELGLSALVEAHDGDEVRSALAAGARVVGVNNRNLKDFSVDFGNARRLRELIPEGVRYVAESGVTGPADAALIAKTGADAVLVGEALMRAASKRALLDEMRAAAAKGRMATAPAAPTDGDRP